ncbi:uncharacterized protein [Asterias amurensis]|uniref:uncharacterized protein n=1 Tax=Asterias amurensis TaxID=7602 RepID=UPI003AB5A071
MGREDLNKARKKRLEDNAVKFQNKVVPSELLPHLTCLTPNAKERIERKEDRLGATSAAYELTMVIYKNDDWFEQLIPALREIGQNKLADLLDDPKVDHGDQRPGVQQNGPQPDPSFNPRNDRQTVDKGNGATFSPHRPRNQGASRYPPYQNEEQRGERVTGDTLYRQLPATVMDVLRLLDEPSISGRDWKGLAGRLGYNIDIVERLKLKERPTEALLLEWGFGEEATLNSLLKALRAIERVDVYQQLQDVLGFHNEGFDQIPPPNSPRVPSVGNLPKLDHAWDDSKEAKVETKKQPRKRNDKPRDSSSEANRAGETISDGDKRNAGNSGSDITNTGSSGQVEAKEVNKERPVKDQVGTGQSSGCSEAPGATTCVDEPITNRDETKSMTKSKTDTSDQDIAPESKSTTSEGGSIMNNLNRNPHAMKQNISTDQKESALEPKPQNNQQYVEDNLRESDQQSSNMTMTNGTKMVASNNASVNYNLDRGGQAADQRFSDPVDENCTGKTLLSQTSRASTTSSLNDDMDTMYSTTGPDDFYRSLRNPDSLDETIGTLQISAASFPSDVDDSKSLENLADSQSTAMNTPGTKATQNTTGKDTPSSSSAPMGLATPSASATTISPAAPSPARSTLAVTPSPARSTLAVTPSPARSTLAVTPSPSASSTQKVISTADTKGSESPHNTTLVPKSDRVQKSMKGTPVTQPAHVPADVPADVPGGLRMPSVDATFSKDSLEVAITPGRMLVQSQTASTQEAEGKLQQIDAKQPASGIQDDPHEAKQHLPSDGISTNSTLTSPQHEEDVTGNQTQSMSEDNPGQELQESILEPQENGTPVTQPAHVPADVPGGWGTPSVDATFSKDSLMVAITPGRMLRESQTASTQEAEGKLQQLDAKQPASGIQDDPHKAKQHLPSDGISTNSTLTSPQHKEDVTGNQTQSMSEDNPGQELQESILEPQENGTPVTQPAHVPADVPGGWGTPSVDATFSKDSLMVAITPGRMLRESQTASTQEAEGKLQQLDAKQPASGIQDDPHKAKQHLPSDGISTNSTLTSPQHEEDVTGNQTQSMSEDNPGQELQESILEPQENADSVPPEIEEPQGTSVLGSFLRAGPALLSFVSSVQSGDFAPYNN